jgi:hypothetical protein
MGRQKKTLPNFVRLAEIATNGGAVVLFIFGIVSLFDNTQRFAVSAGAYSICISVPLFLLTCDFHTVKRFAIFKKARDFSLWFNAAVVIALSIFPLLCFSTLLGALLLLGGGLLYLTSAIVKQFD